MGPTYDVVNARIIMCACFQLFVVLLTEVDMKLQSAEARCKVLEKQLDYMRKMVENVKKERNVLMENEVEHQIFKINSII